MEKSEVQRKVQLATSEEVFRKTGRIFVPVASSARHVHLCHADVERLFGPGHQLTVFRMLSQPGPRARPGAQRHAGGDRHDRLVQARHQGARPHVRQNGRNAGLQARRPCR